MRFHKPRLRNFTLLVFGIGLVGFALLAWFGLGLRPQPAQKNEALFQGITYARLVRQTPRSLVVHVVRVKLNQKGLSFLVTPGDPKRELPLKARTTSQFLSEYKLQVAINGDSFSPWRNTALDDYPKPGDPVAPTGLAASKGVIYSRATDNLPTLYISRTNQARFNPPPGQIYNAISGNHMLVDRGQVQPDLDEDLQPRTAVGLDRRSRELILVVVDGRQPGFSEGVSLLELASLMIEFNAYWGMNLDGGGSSTLVVQDPSGQPKVLNSPVEHRWPGRERPVGNHLGIFAPGLSSK